MLKAPTHHVSGPAPTGTPAHQNCWRRDGAGGLRRGEKEEPQEQE